MAKYSRTFSSGGKQVSTANQVVDFLEDGRNYGVDFLKFETFGTQCTIKLNNEDTIHWLDANSELIFEDIFIDKFTIVDSGVEYLFTAMSKQ